MASARKGTMVDERYRLDRKIGTGGMADVWLAEDTELDRNVAIKILHDRFAQDGEFVQRFQREAQSAAGLQHPNVVGVFDRGSFDDSYFIAMELIRGANLEQFLDQLIERKRVLPRELAVFTLPLELLFVRAAGVADAHFVDSQLPFGDFYCDLRLKSEAVFFEANGLNDLPPENFVAGFHVGQVDVGEAI